MTDLIHRLDDPLSEAWLRAVGFKWHEFERQGAKHWMLWLGDVIRDDGSLTSYDDLGIELAPGAYAGRDCPKRWFCWLRSDAAHRYSRFIHLRTLATPRDVVNVIFGVAGVEFDPDNVLYGSLHTPERAARLKADDARLRDRPDRAMLRSGHPWSDVERDCSRGRPLSGHLEAAVKSGLAK